MVGERANYFHGSFCSNSVILAVLLPGRPPSLVVGQVDGTVTAINLADMSIIANNERHHTQEVTTIDVSLKYLA